MTMTAPIENRTSQRSGAQRARAGKAGKAGGAGTTVARLAFDEGVAGGISDMKNSVCRPKAWQETDPEQTHNTAATTEAGNRASGSSAARRDTPVAPVADGSI